jgi:hypothetical protein
MAEPTHSERPQGRFVRSDARAPERREANRGWYWLLLVPCLAVLFPWIYNTDSPELFGIPFFYWYQMAWVPISVIVTVIVYRATTRRGAR